jgi:hypothetical protein
MMDRRTITERQQLMDGTIMDVRMVGSWEPV